MRKIFSLLSGVYVDSFGFRISLPDEKMAIHYMATKINEYYESPQIFL